jgi:hypothetical protein
MNVFCCRRVTQSRALALKLGFEVGELPKCGFRAGIPRDLGVDRTEIDMKLGTLLAESKLTEADFQNQRPEIVESYRDLRKVFDRELLPRPNRRYAPHPVPKCLRLCDGAPPPAPDLIPGRKRTAKLSRNSHSDGYSNGGTSVPMWGKTNGLSATLLWEPYPLRRAWTPVLEQREL